MSRQIKYFLVLKLLGRQVILSLQLYQRAGYYPPLRRIQFQKNSNWEGGNRTDLFSEISDLLKNDQHIEDSH